MPRAPAAPARGDQDALHLGGVGLTEPRSALKHHLAVVVERARSTTAPATVRRPAAVRPPSAAIGEKPTSSVNIATQAGSTLARSSGARVPTSGSGSTCGIRSVATGGWHARTSRALPGRLHGRDQSRAPARTHQRDGRARRGGGRSAKASTCRSSPSWTGIRLAPDRQALVSCPRSKRAPDLPTQPGGFGGDRAPARRP